MIDQPLSTTPPSEPAREVHVRVAIGFVEWLCQQDEPGRWRDSWRVRSGIPQSAKLVGYHLDGRSDEIVLRFQDGVFALAGPAFPTIRVDFETRR